MNLNIYEIILLTWFLLSLGINMAKHGEERPQMKFNFWQAFIIFTIHIALLYGAGLFR